MNKKFRYYIPPEENLCGRFIYSTQKGFNFCGDLVIIEGFAAVNEKNVQQWTGLLDKNGREIYEGDIVLLQEGECDAATKHTCEIFIKQTNHSAAFFHARPLPRDDRGRQFSLYRNIYEIIGNIFETPLDNDPTKD